MTIVYLVVFSITLVLNIVFIIENIVEFRNSTELSQPSRWVIALTFPFLLGSVASCVVIFFGGTSSILVFLPFVVFTLVGASFIGRKYVNIETETLGFVKSFARTSTDSFGRRPLSYITSGPRMLGPFESLTGSLLETRSRKRTFTVEAEANRIRFNVPCEFIAKVRKEVAINLYLLNPRNFEDSIESAMGTAEGFMQSLVLDFLKDKDISYFLGNRPNSERVVVRPGENPSGTHGGALDITECVDDMVEDTNHPIRKTIGENTGLEVYDFLAKDPSFASEETKKALDAQATGEVQRAEAKLNLIAKGLIEGSDEWKAAWDRAIDDYKENRGELVRTVFDIRGDDSRVNRNLWMNSPPRT